MVTDGLNPFTVLAFLGAVLGGGALAVAYIFARITGRAPLAKAVLVVGGVGAGAYLLLFAIASNTSRDRVLALGDEKHICEVDCHLAGIPTPFIIGHENSLFHGRTTFRLGA